MSDMIIVIVASVSDQERASATISAVRSEQDPKGVSAGGMPCRLPSQNELKLERPEHEPAKPKCRKSKCRKSEYEKLQGVIAGGAPRRLPRNREKLRNR